MAPDILIVGHVVKDITPSGWTIGGGAYYAAAQASKLGLGVAVVTACDSDIEPERLLAGVEWHIVPSLASTTFENRYDDGRRSQRLHAVGQRLTLSDIPPQWRALPLVLLAPVFHDIDPELPGELAANGSMVALGAQGWLRRRDGGEVRPGRVDVASSWLSGEIVFVSEEDVDDPEKVVAWRARLPVVVLTRDARGCTVWDANGRFDLDPVSTYEVDPTGAGDIFAAAFVLRYKETGDPQLAARFAAAAAGLSLRGQGQESIAGRDEIEALLRGEYAGG
jgi:hypothetical protein